MVLFFLITSQKAIIGYFYKLAWLFQVINTLSETLDPRALSRSKLHWDACSDTYYHQTPALSNTWFFPLWYLFWPLLISVSIHPILACPSRKKRSTQLWVWLLRTNSFLMHSCRCSQTTPKSQLPHLAVWKQHPLYILVSGPKVGTTLQWLYLQFSNASKIYSNPNHCIIENSLQKFAT